MRIGTHAADRSCEQCDAVPNGEEADIKKDILQPVEEEDHADQKQQVIVAGHHVLGAEVHQGPDRGAVDHAQEQRVLIRYAVRVHDSRGEHTNDCDGRRPEQPLSLHVVSYLVIGVSRTMAVGRMPFGPFVKSVIVPSAKRWRSVQTSCSLSRGLRATKLNSANSPGLMFMFHEIPVMRSPVRFSSYVQPTGIATVSMVTPSGTSISAPTVITLPSVGTR